MKHLPALLTIFLTAAGLLSTTEQNMRTSLWLEIFDKDSSLDTLEFEKIGYHDIPRELDIRGILVEALRWEDSSGKNYILVLTQTGIFPVTVKLKIENKKIKIGDRAELNAYLFSARNKTTTYKKIWTLFDFQDCNHLQIYAGFIKNSLTITDLNNNNIPEITFLYTKSCRADETSPAGKKLFMYEGKTKYAIRSLIPASSARTETESYKISNKLEKNITFKNFALKRWNTLVPDKIQEFTY